MGHAQHVWSGCTSHRSNNTFAGAPKPSQSTNKINKRDLSVRSQILAGHLSTDAISSHMMEEVIPSMKNDKTGKLAKKDKLIMALGESWLVRNKGNQEKRKNYASQHIRLASRLLQYVSPDGKQNLWEVLIPKNFDKIVDAALKCACPSQDIEFLESPSNAIKLKYDILRLAQMKLSTQLKNGVCAKESKALIQLININWSQQVTTHARTELQRRKLSEKKEYPSPKDIALLTTHLRCSLETAKCEENNFHRLIELLLVRLMTFNKRRSGEIEVIKYVFLNRSMENLYPSRATDQPTPGAHGPLTRYGKLQVAHAPGMPGTFSPAANFKGNH